MVLSTPCRQPSRHPLALNVTTPVGPFHRNIAPSSARRSRVPRGPRATPYLPPMRSTRLRRHAPARAGTSCASTAACTDECRHQTHLCCCRWSRLVRKFRLGLAESMLLRVSTVQGPSHTRRLLGANRSPALTLAPSCCPKSDLESVPSQRAGPQPHLGPPART